MYFGLTVIGCQHDSTSTIHETKVSALERLPNNQAGEVIRKSITHAGGWDNWEAKNNFQFYKNIIQLDSTGKEKRRIRQLHQYQLQPSFKARMTWEIDGTNYTIVNTGQQAWKYENGKELTDDQSQKEAWNSSFGSHYVVSMPFKLTDPGVILKYDGIDTLDSGQVVHAVKVDYEKGAGSSGGFHVWWYYFDKDTYALAANYLDYGNGYSYTEYQTTKVVDGIVIQENRNSHQAFKDKSVGYIKTVYENDGMQFDVALTDNMFEPIAQ